MADVATNTCVTKCRLAREAVFRRVPYDLDAAQERVRKAGLPKRLRSG